jgi:PilZ domain
MQGVPVEKRKQQRARKRLTCELVWGASRHTALVRDLSRSGLFVQTRVKLEPGTRIQVVFAASGGFPGFEVEARAIRQRQIAPRLQPSVPGGVGLELIDPPDAFRELLEAGYARDAGEAPEKLERSDAGHAQATGVRTFRVRLVERDKPNARVLTVRAESVHGARARALARAGRDWKIADIQEI